MPPASHKVTEQADTQERLAPVEGHDEIADLVRSFNATVEHVRGPSQRALRGSSLDFPDAAVITRGKHEELR